MSAFAGERRASKVPRGGAARARPGSVENDATLPPPARRARYPPARIFHQSRGLPRATAPGCQRGCRADLAGHDPGRNGQTHSIARLRRDRDPEPILYESIDPPGGPRSGPPVLHRILCWRERFCTPSAQISPRDWEKCFENHFLETWRFRGLCAIEEGPHLPRGGEATSARARAPRERTASEAGAGRSRTPGPRGAKVRSGSARDREARARSTIDRALTPTSARGSGCSPPRGAFEPRAAAPPRVRRPRPSTNRRPQLAPYPTLTLLPPAPRPLARSPRGGHDPPRRANP